MIDRPILVSTPVGPLAAIVTLPDGDPLAMAMVMQGNGGTRSGANQMLRGVAHSLALDGVATLRADYAGLAESFDANPRERVAGVRALVAAFRELMPSAPFFIVASCYGVAPAASVIHEVDVSAVAIVSPVVLTEPLLKLVHEQTQPVRRALGRARHRLRYGSRRPRALVQAERVDTREGIATIAATVPVFVLVGSLDRSANGLRLFLPTLPDSSHVELEVAEGHALHAASTPDAQRVIQDGVRRWAAGAISAAQVRA